MHRGCFVRTSSPPLAGRRSPRPPPFFSCFLFSAAPLVSFFLWFPAPAALGLGALFLFSPPPRLVFFFFVVRPRCLWLSLVSGRGCPGPRRCVLFVLLGFCSSALCALPPPLLVSARLFAAPWWFLPPPPLCPLLFFSCCHFVLRFFFRCAPPLSLVFFCFLAPGALGLGAVCFVGLPLPGSPCALASFVVPAWRLAASWWLLHPPPLVTRCFPRPRFVLRFFFRCAPPLSLVFSGLRPRVPWALALCAVCFVGLPLFGSPCALAPLVFPAWPLAAPWWFLPPPPPFVSRCSSRCLFVLRFFFVASPCCLWFSLVSGPGCPGPWRCVLFVLLASRSSALRALSPLLWFLPGCWLLLARWCPPFCVSLFFSLPLCAPFFSFCAPVVSGFLPFPAPGALGLGAVGLFCRPPASRLSVRSHLFCVSRLAVGCLVVFAAPPPPLCLAVFVAATRCSVFFSSLLLGSFRRLLPPSWCVRGALCCLVLPRCGAPLFCVVCCGASPCCAVGCCVLCGVYWGVCLRVVLRCWLLLRVVPCLWPCRPVGLFAVWLAAWFWSALPCAVLCCVSLGAVPRRAAARHASRCCVVVCCVVLLRLFGVAVCFAVSSGAACRPLALCFAALCFAVFPRAVCSVLCVFRRGVLVPAVVRRCAACCVCPQVLRCAFPVLCALCGAVFRCARALASCSSCGACCCWRLVLWCAAVCCAVSLVFRGAVLGLAARGRLLAVCFSVGVPVWPRGLVPCGCCGLLWCPASLCCVLGCCAVSWCCPVVFCPHFAVLFVLALPSCGLSCRGALCCWLSVLFCARWWCLCALVPCLSLLASTRTLIMTLCYPAPVSASLGHVVEGSGLGFRRIVADPRGCL